MRVYLFTGLFISVIAMSGGRVAGQDQDEIEILKKKVLADVKSNWSVFDTCFHKSITLELKRYNEKKAVSDGKITSARFSWTPGFVHKFYLICSAAEGFHCTLKLYKFSEVRGLPNRLVSMIEVSGTSKDFVTFSHLLDTENEWLLVLENDSDTQGVAFAMITTQISENDDFRQRMNERD